MSRRFETSDPGEYVSQDGSVLSETQAYALLRAVWSDDRESFERIWGWTATHLMQSDGLPVWRWRDGSVLDAHSATDADTDMALALLMGSKRWNDSSLLAAGQSLVRAIWAREVVYVAGKPLVTTGDWVNTEHDPLVPFNPSYFAPYAYRVFQEADPEHDWRGVIDSGYATLFALSGATLGATRSSGLPPDWVGLDASTGNLSPLVLEGKPNTTEYGYDAARTYWRIAVDRDWSDDGRAATYLAQAGFLRDEVARKGAPSAVYAHDGSVVEEASSTVGIAGALGALSTLDPPAANGLYAAKVLGEVQVGPAGAVWGNPDDVYEQAWGWFATALYAGRTVDVWHAS
jgi:endoglucanase